MWQQLIGLLTWLSADPHAVDREHPRAVAAVAYAYAAAGDEGEPPAPSPPAKCACGGTCVDGYYKPDGTIVERCPCEPSCDCRRQ